MKVFFFMVFFLEIFRKGNCNLCEGITEKNDCIKKNGCCYVENNYKTIKNKECLKLRPGIDKERFCNMLYNMNKEEGFELISCETIDYKFQQ